jgi:phosphomannomutase
MRIAASGQLTQLISALKVPAESKEFRLKIRVEDFKTYGNDVIEQLRAFVSTVPGWSIVPENYEGIRISCDATAGQGWLLLRLSLHDPVIPLNIESDIAGGIDIIKNKLKTFFENYDSSELDYSSLM